MAAAWAQSIRRHHPLLHLTFQEHAYLVCAVKLLAPAVWLRSLMSAPPGRAGRSGSAKVDVRVGMRVRRRPLNAATLALLLPFSCCCSHCDQREEGF